MIKGIGARRHRCSDGNEAGVGRNGVANYHRRCCRPVDDGWLAAGCRTAARIAQGQPVGKRIARLRCCVGDTFLKRESRPVDDVDGVSQRHDRWCGTGGGSRRVKAARGVYAKLIAVASSGATGHGCRDDKIEYAPGRQGAGAADRDIVVRNPIRIRIGEDLQGGEVEAARQIGHRKAEAVRPVAGVGQRMRKIDCRAWSAALYGVRRQREACYLAYRDLHDVGDVGTVDAAAVDEGTGCLIADHRAGGRRGQRGVGREPQHQAAEPRQEATSASSKRLAI